MAPAIETAVLKILLDRDTGVPDRLHPESLLRPSQWLARDAQLQATTVPERLQSIESSIAAHVAERAVVVSLMKSSPAAEVWERAEVELCRLLSV